MTDTGSPLWPQVDAFLHYMRVERQLEVSQVRSLATRSKRQGLQATSMVLRSFLDWQVSIGPLGANPAPGCSRAASRPASAENMDVDEVGQLLDIDTNDPMALRDRYAPKDDAVFITNSVGRISARNVQKRFAEWGMKQGVNSHIHPHKLCHSFATHMLESSGNLRAVQELLGHANLSTTQIYTHLDFHKHLASVYDVAHPRAKWGKT